MAHGLVSDFRAYWEWYRIAIFDIPIGSRHEVIVLLSGKQNSHTFRWHHFKDQLEKPILKVVAFANPVHLGTDAKKCTENTFIGSRGAWLAACSR